MTDNFPINNVVKATKTLERIFKDLGPQTNEELLFETFAEVCSQPALGGDPFQALPATFKVVYPEGHPQAGQKKLFRVHAAWFRKEGSLDAFAAVVYDPETTGFYFTHDLDKNWPSWVDDFVHKLTVHVRSAEMDKKYPPPTKTVN